MLEHPGCSGSIVKQSKGALPTIAPAASYSEVLDAIRSARREGLNMICLEAKV